MPHGTVTVNVEVPVKFIPDGMRVVTGLVANDAVVPAGMTGAPTPVVESARFAWPPNAEVVTVAV